MIALLQRVSQAAVSVEGKEISRIGNGVVVLLGVFTGDTQEDARFLAHKTANLRIFDDMDGSMNYSLIDIGGEALSISQFTLCANARKGRRPSFSQAMNPNDAEKLYELFCEELAAQGVNVGRGIFGGEMDVEIHNDGPVTIILNSRESRRLNIKEGV
jgi:D-tyrosyl-tRNA(Tyr) deacylase